MRLRVTKNLSLGLTAQVLAPVAGRVDKALDTLDEEQSAVLWEEAQEEAARVLCSMVPVRARVAGVPSGAAVGLIQQIEAKEVPTVAEASHLWRRTKVRGSRGLVRISEATKGEGSVQ